ncbi:hypothetical protein [Clavibacter nebraskensis]|uniref:hypothetical protein n=1 Tax=Clavibacter nebraskensis TaxID=31963 RepID=UPI003F4BECCA
MMRLPKRTAIVGVTVIGLIVAGTMWTLHSADDEGPDVESTTTGTPAAAPVPRAQEQGARGTEVPGALSSDALTAAGSEISVGLPATLTITTASGAVVYARVTLDELTQLAPTDAAAVIADVPAAAGFTTVYAMPVSMTVLSVTDKGGAPTASSPLTLGDLAGFSIAVRPGSDPVPSTPSVSSPGCPELPQTLAALHAGAELQWCLHAFSGGHGAGAPTGGQYQAPAGRYVSAITWASKAFKASSEIP